jgi:zinc D-Ala-D-Ala carboxypeptidase
MPILLSEHFTLEEATISETASRRGIDNSHHAPQIITNASKTAVHLESVRKLLGGNSIHINSWIRCIELNRALGSKDSSQHISGEAVDFICPSFGTPTDIAKIISEQVGLIGFDQLILEHTWVHISWSSLPNARQRNQVLSLLSNGSYSRGLTDNQGNHL